MKKFLISFLTATWLAMPTTAAVLPMPVAAQNFGDEACRGANFDNPSTACTDTGFLTSFRKITNVIIFIVGAAAVIMVIVGGLMYVFSGGTGENTKRAKDTVLFAIIGLVVAILSYAIVNFVIARVTAP
jgi:hypothetical protein